MRRDDLNKYFIFIIIKINNFTGREILFYSDFIISK